MPLSGNLGGDRMEDGRWQKAAEKVEVSLTWDQGRLKREIVSRAGTKNFSLLSRWVKLNGFKTASMEWQELLWRVFLVLSFSPLHFR